MIWTAACLAAGAGVGFLAGLLGIGGGMTLVPILATMFGAQALAPDYTVHLALGTGMASVLFTSSASVREHHRHAAVDWHIVARIAPGMLLGALPVATLRRVFAGLLYLLATKMAVSAW